MGGIEEGKSIQKQLQPSEDDPSYMKKLILEDFKDRTEKNLIFSFLTKASALDPMIEEESKEHLKEITQDDKKKPEFKPIVQKRKPGLDYESDDTIDSYAKKDAIKREVENYRAEPEPTVEEDILSWRLFNRVKYPNLARLARLVHGVKCV